MTLRPYIYRWNREDRKGQPCEVSVRGRMNSCCVRFADGYSDGDQAYIAGLDVQLHEDAPLFRTRGAAPGPRGGRRHNPLPYQKSSLIDDFADIRRLVFGKDEKRRLMDMRRTGAVEAVSGVGGTVVSIAAKMGNSIDQKQNAAKNLHASPNLAAVRRSRCIPAKSGVARICIGTE